jgi:hypothetical protein
MSMLSIFLYQSPQDQDIEPSIQMHLHTRLKFRQGKRGYRDHNLIYVGLADHMLSASKADNYN